MNNTSLEPSSHSHPLVLFDGVCNLCHAAVQWLIARDPAGKLHYASLQSRAARDALATAGVDDPTELPDSIVLVDGAGVHVRSTAALRIAGSLGVPYSLCRAAFVIPRPLRDAVYRMIARNRYRWFGRRDTCLRPTAELSARFLDADEPVTVVPDRPEIDPGTPSVSASAAWLKTGLTRLALVYVILYMLPFPLSLLEYVPRLPLMGDIPGLGAAVSWLVGLYGRVTTPMVTWMGGLFFGVDATLEFTGSGDRTFNYVQLVVTAALAVIVAAGWTAVRRGRPVTPKLLDLSRVLVRYSLATTLLTYGWVKVFPLQFSLPGPDRLIQSYGDSSPMGLAWTFLGASTAYQIFGGVCELAGGYLLFWRRTALLGSVVAAAVLTNVMAINYFYDVPVKLYSTHLMVMAIFIMTPDLPRLVGLFGFNLPIATRPDKPFWTTPRVRRAGITTVHLVLVGTITTYHITDNLQSARSFGYLREQSPLAGIYRVEHFEHAGRADRDAEDTIRWVRVGINPPFTATVQRASGDAVRMRLAVDEEAQTLSMFDRGGQAPSEPQFGYTAMEPGVIRLEGFFEGAPTTVVMRKSEEGALLLERRYKWINEYPFNR